MKSQEDEFYGELDRKKLTRSCCTAQTMLLFFLGLLAVAVFGTIYGYNQIKKNNFSRKTILATVQDKNNFSAKLKINPSSQTFSIPITSEELTAVTAEGISGKNFIIKNVQVVIGKDGIDIFGTLTKPLSSQIKITVVPQIENGKIKFAVQKVTAGNLAMPKFIDSEVEAVFQKTMDQNFEPLYANYEVTNINLYDDQMIVSGNLK